jgi:hypothetical protein
MTDKSFHPYCCKFKLKSNKHPLPFSATFDFSPHQEIVISFFCALVLRTLSYEIASLLLFFFIILLKILLIFGTYLLTYLRSWALLEELSIVQPLRNPPAFHGTRRFNTMFTRALHWSLSRAISIQSTPSHPVSLRSILILPTHLHLGLPSGLFPSDFGNTVRKLFATKGLRATQTELATYTGTEISAEIANT